MSTTKKELVVLIEGVIIGTSPHCHYFKKDKCEMEKDDPFAHPQKKKRSTSPPRKEREVQQKNLTKEKHRLEFCERIANHRSRIIPGKLCILKLQGASTMSKWTNGILTLRR